MSKFITPSFIIIGERKCGTSSLYRYLIDHPQILPCKVKEPQFFSRSRLGRILYWSRYKAQFPLLDKKMPAEIKWFSLQSDGRIRSDSLTFTRSEKFEITGEASANTMSHVRPEIVKHYLPQVKLIAVLRNPVDRAISHYRMLKRFQDEGRRLPRRIIGLAEDVAKDLALTERSGTGLYVPYGRYALYLSRWFETFGRENVKVLFDDEIRAEQANTSLGEIVRWLGVEAHDFSGSIAKQYNVTPSEEVDPEVLQNLRDYYHKYDDQLAELLKSDLPWS